MPILRPRPKLEDAVDDGGVAELAAAEAEYSRIAAERQQLQTRLAGLEAAHAVNTATEWERNSGDGRVQRWEQAIAQAFPRGAPRDKKIADMIEDTRHDIVGHTPAVAAATERLNAARRARTDALAISLQARHRAAALAIAAGLEQLSIALDAEAGVRRELQLSAPMPTSAFLPNLSLPGIGSLADVDSPASLWAAAVRKMGIAA